MRLLHIPFYQCCHGKCQQKILEVSSMARITTKHSSRKACLLVQGGWTTNRPLRCCVVNTCKYTFLTRDSCFIALILPGGNTVALKAMWFQLLPSNNITVLQ